MPETAMDADADLAALAEDLRRAVGNFVRAVRADTGTPRTAQSDTLDLLDREGDTSTAALAKRRNVKHQSMRLVIEQLARDGLVARSADPEDRRAQILTITAAGRTMLAQSRGARAAWIGGLIRERLSAEDRRDLARTVALLDRLGSD